MDPLGNQPAQPNPQQPIAPTPPVQPAQSPVPITPPVSPEAIRPEPATPPVAPVERPVESWPPAGTPAATEAAQMTQAPQPLAPTPSPPGPQMEAQTLGTEVSEAAGATPIAPITAAPATAGGMDGFVSPAAKELKDAVAANPIPPEAPMSDQQADQLFQEEPATKARKKHHRIKKIILTLLILLITVLIAGGAYIFIFGNKAAQSYVDTSSTTSYKESFSQVKAALSEEPVDSAELEAGISKLKVATDNTKELQPVFFGSLNPNYKKAHQLAALEAAYKLKAKEYQSNYAEYADYLKALSDSFSVISGIEELKDIDLAVVTAEKVSTDLTDLVKKCGVASKALKDSTKPSDLGTSSEAMQDYMVKICTESMDAIQKVPLAFLVGKTGVLNPQDQATLKGYFNAYQNLTTKIEATSSEVKIEKLTAYQQSALEDATTLLQEAEAILKG